uniref:Uncharacterized protein n=1 Tax=Anguilla anguilla TaxID=7936 RepID=A0A0E9WKT1_ANGAN
MQKRENGGYVRVNHTMCIYVWNSKKMCSLLVPDHKTKCVTIFHSADLNHRMYFYLNALK